MINFFLLQLKENFFLVNFPQFLVGIFQFLRWTTNFPAILRLPVNSIYPT